MPQPRSPGWPQPAPWPLKSSAPSETSSRPPAIAARPGSRSPPRWASRPGPARKNATPTCPAAGPVHQQRTPPSPGRQPGAGQTQHSQRQPPRRPPARHRRHANPAPASGTRRTPKSPPGSSATASMTSSRHPATPTPEPGTCWSAASAPGWSAPPGAENAAGTPGRQSPTPERHSRPPGPAGSPPLATPAPATPLPSACCTRCYETRKTSQETGDSYPQHEPGRRRRRTRRAAAVPHWLDRQRPPPRPSLLAFIGHPAYAGPSSATTWTASHSSSAATTANHSSSPALYPHSAHRRPAFLITVGNP